MLGLQRLHYDVCNTRVAAANILPGNCSRSKVYISENDNITTKRQHIDGKEMTKQNNYRHLEIYKLSQSIVGL